jgi:hypothetical protein
MFCFKTSVSAMCSDRYLKFLTGSLKSTFVSNVSFCFVIFGETNEQKGEIGFYTVHSEKYPLFIFLNLDTTYILYTYK